jgi:hypothetical protein
LPLADAGFSQLIKTLVPLMAPSKPLMANMILGCKKFGWWKSLERRVADFVTGSMVFDFVHLACWTVPQ